MANREEWLPPAPGPRNTIPQSLSGRPGASVLCPHPQHAWAGIPAGPVREERKPGLILPRVRLFCNLHLIPVPLENPEELGRKRVSGHFVPLQAPAFSGSR